MLTFLSHTLSGSPKRARGYTIVELLVMIVVITILASISLVSYQSITQRANNAAIISAASQSLRLIQTYIVANGAYPLTGGLACVTSETGCGTGNIAANTTFDANMATMGTLPKRVPAAGPVRGIWYGHVSPVTFNGISQPAILTYYLAGQNQQCGLPGVMYYTADNTAITSTAGYTRSDTANNQTGCQINIPGPSV